MHEIVVAAFGVFVGLITFFADKAKIEIDRLTGRICLGMVVVAAFVCAQLWDDPTFNVPLKIPAAQSSGNSGDP